MLSYGEFSAGFEIRSMGHNGDQEFVPLVLCISTSPILKVTKMADCITMSTAINFFLKMGNIVTYSISLLFPMSTPSHSTRYTLCCSYLVGNGDGQQEQQKQPDMIHVWCWLQNHRQTDCVEVSVAPHWSTAPGSEQSQSQPPQSQTHTVTRRESRSHGRQRALDSSWDVGGIQGLNCGIWY